MKDSMLGNAKNSSMKAVPLHFRGGGLLGWTVYQSDGASVWARYDEKGDAVVETDGTDSGRVLLDTLRQLGELEYGTKMNYFGLYFAKALSPRDPIDRYCRCLIDGFPSE